MVDGDMRMYAKNDKNKNPQDVRILRIGRNGGNGRHAGHAVYGRAGALRHAAKVENAATATMRTLQHGMEYNDRIWLGCQGAAASDAILGVPTLP
jgi:hypothetical protein